MAIQMSNREKYFVGSAAVVIALLVIYQFIINPFVEGSRNKTRAVTTKASQLDEMRSMKAEYDDLVNKNKSLQNLSGTKEKGFTLFSFLDNLAGTTGIKETIKYMKPSVKGNISLVEMKLQGVDMAKLMNYLYEIETSPNGVFVKGMSLTKTGKDKNQLTAILQVETVNEES